MKFQKLAYLIRNRENTIGIFGTARLVKDSAGNIQLHGGSLDDRRAARDYLRQGGGNRNLPTAKVPAGPSLRAQASQWCSHFLHNAAIEVHPVRKYSEQATRIPAPDSALPAIAKAA